MINKVAIINSVFDYGSTGNLARQLYEYGKNKGYETFAFFGRGDTYADKHIIRIDSKAEVYLHKILTLITGYEGIYSNRATKSLIKKLEEEKINKIILLNIHGYYLNEYKLLGYLKKFDIRTVYLSPDEYPGLGKCCFNNGCNKYKTECYNCKQVKGYPKSLFFDRSREIFQKKKKCYDGFQNLVVAGPHTNIEKFKESELLKKIKLSKLDWGIDINQYRYSLNQQLYQKYNIPQDKILILTVAKYSMKRKGVADFFFPVARNLEGTSYHFINVGYDGKLSNAEIPTNMTLIPYINNQEELTEIYSICDAYLLASTSDTMPISCLIALACETPVYCFYTSGLKYIASKDSEVVNFVKIISVDALTDSVSKVTKKTIDIRKKCREYAIKRYSNDIFNATVYRLLEENI